MRRALSVIGGVGLGLSLSQFPEYAQQYEQRLGGAVDELRTVVADFDASAARAGMNRDQALQTYAASEDRFFNDRGRDMQNVIMRYDKLSAHLAALEQAGPVERAVDFARFYDARIGERALEAYNPAVPVSAEGFAYAGTGVVAGYGLTAGILALARRLFRRRRPARMRLG